MASALRAKPVATNAVVAICVVLVPTVAVGAVGVPDSAGSADSTILLVPVVLLPLRAVSVELSGW